MDKWGQCIGILLACFVLGLLAQAAMQQCAGSQGEEPTVGAGPPCPATALWVPSPAVLLPPFQSAICRKLLVLKQCSHAPHCCRDISAFGRGLYARQLPPEQQLTPLQQQLMGCRTFKNEEIPFVDETASLKVLDTYTLEQRQTAEQFTAAVAACTNFTCLRQANKLVSRGCPGKLDAPERTVRLG